MGSLSQAPPSQWYLLFSGLCPESCALISWLHCALLFERGQTTESKTDKKRTIFIPILLEVQTHWTEMKFSLSLDFWFLKPQSPQNYLGTGERKHGLTKKKKKKKRIFTLSLNLRSSLSCSSSQNYQAFSGGLFGVLGCHKDSMWLGDSDKSKMINSPLIWGHIQFQSSFLNCQLVFTF